MYVSGLVFRYMIDSRFKRQVQKRSQWVDFQRINKTLLHLLKKIIV